MHISYKPLWHTLVERNMRKEDLRIAAGLTTNMIANMGKGKKYQHGNAGSYLRSPELWHFGCNRIGEGRPFC